MLLKVEMFYLFKGSNHKGQGITKCCSSFFIYIF